MYQSRLARLRKRMADENISAFFITALADIRWLSGYTGSTAYLLLTQSSAIFATDGRYETQCRQSLSSFWELKIVSNYNTFFKLIGEQHAKLTVQPSTPASIILNLCAAKAGGLADISIDEKDIMQTLRMIKMPDEVAAIRAEYELAGKAFLASVAAWQYNDTEQSWAATLEYNMKKLGAVAPSFETIVASGERGALPHGVASDRIIRQGEAVTIDFGSMRTYNSDYTRVVYDGNNAEILSIIDIVRAALEAAMAAVRPGVYANDIDAVARDFIANYGYKDYFNHGLGHGVGAEVHELPHISPRSDTRIEEGMVFTIEPGIYIPDKYGIRLEQTVCVTAGGCELLSDTLDKYVYNLR